jgi:hypothetical protein
MNQMTFESPAFNNSMVLGDLLSQQHKAITYIRVYPWHSGAWGSASAAQIQLLEQEYV